MVKLTFPKKVLARINIIRVPEDKMLKLDYMRKYIDNRCKWVDGLSIHEFLKFEIMKLGERLGYLPIPEFYLPTIHGTTEFGQVDVVWGDVGGRSSRLLFAFEIERGFPSEKTLLKLKHLKNLVKYKAVLMYTKRHPFYFLPTGADYLHEFTKHGIAIIGTLPTLAEVWREKCREIRETLVSLKEDLKIDKTNEKYDPIYDPRLNYNLRFLNSLDSRIDQIDKVIKFGTQKEKNRKFRLVTQDYLKIAEQIDTCNEETPIPRIWSIANQIKKRKIINSLIL